MCYSKNIRANQGPPSRLDESVEGNRIQDVVPEFRKLYTLIAALVNS